MIHKRTKIRRFLALTLMLSLALTGCSQVNKQPQAHKPAAETGTVTAKINQSPVKPMVTRKGSDVYIEITAQLTAVEISRGVMYNAWTFNGTAPGPILRVKEGDRLHITLTNMDPDVPHSLDIHAVHAAPSKNFIDVMPNESRTFTYSATMPGVFMYHCGTQPVLLHLANGMFGVIIVEPKEGYPTDQEVNRAYVITQNEWYKENDYQSFQDGDPQYVVFNGNDYELKEHPLLAKTGDKVRLYVINFGPNHVSSFHVVGTLMDTVYLDGNSQNVLHGLQTVMLPAGGGAVVEFRVTEEGDYPIVSHQFNDASKGAVAVLRVTQDGLDTGAPVMSH